jgi:hypothetical protein
MRAGCQRHAERTHARRVDLSGEDPRNLPADGLIHGEPVWLAEIIEFMEDIDLQMLPHRCR